jgi:hypothetical protein
MLFIFICIIPIFILLTVVSGADTLLSKEKTSSGLLKEDNVLIYGNGSKFTPGMMKELIETELSWGMGIKLDPFCAVVMEAIKSENVAIEGYYNFIFNGYEHFANYFNPNKPDSWDFLFNQSFIQFIRSEVEQGREDEMNEMINNLIIPKYPILKEFNYEFDVKTFTEIEADFQGDLTGHFEEVQTFIFFQQVKSEILMIKLGELTSETRIINLLTTGKRSLKLEVHPYVDFLLNIPLDVWKTVNFPYNAAITDFEYSLKTFVSKSVYFDINRKSPEIIEEVWKNISDETDEMKYFKFLMKFYETNNGNNNSADSNKDWFIISNPLEFYLIQAIQEGNYDLIKILKESLNFLKWEYLSNAFNIALEKDDSLAIEILLDNRIYKDYNSTGVNLFYRAVSNDKRNVIDSFLKGKLNRPCPIMLGSRMKELFEKENFDQLIYILNEYYLVGLGSENLKELLLLSIKSKSQNEKVLEKILTKESTSKIPLISDENLILVYELIFDQIDNLDILKLLFKQEEIFQRNSFKDFMVEMFGKAVNNRKLVLIEFFLQYKCVEEDLILKYFNEVIEEGDEDEINLFEFHFLSNN